MRVKLHHHVSKHDCETCGGTWHDIYSVRGALGQFDNGQTAYCFGTEDGNMDMVVDFLMNSLKERGFDVIIPDSTLLEEMEVDWKSYHDGIDSGIYDWDEKIPDDVKEYNILSNQINDFYSTGWKRVLNSFGYELRLKYSEDEEYYYDDSDDWDY